jgi:predicted thioesterase
MTFEPGAIGEASLVVTPDLTADAMGNRGVAVLATPHLIGLLENSAHAAIRRGIPVGAGTVGTMVEMRHLAATPVGLTVRAKAVLLETDGRRFLFSVEAWDDVDKVAEGRHERYLVRDMAAFLAGAMAKARR